MPVIEQVVGSLVVDAATGVAKQGVASAFAKLQKERRLIGMSVWRPGGKARISVSALLRIQRDDGCFAVIKNLHRPEDYSAIGGVYKCHPKSGPLELDAFGFIPENRMQGEDVTNDVRGYTRRKFIGKILKWSAEEQSAIERGEECLRREIREELAEETTILPKDFPFDLLRFKYSHQYLKLSSWEQDLAPLTQAQLFRVYDLHGTREAFALFEQISSIPGDEILWVSRNDILDGRCSVHNKPIGAPCELFIRNSIRRMTAAPPNMRPR
ncbi:hypothetical protein FHR21_000338 [Sphingopyxis panaciterrulae]|uniref:Nudix hydrolase domain-containing protein n=2 Tax=Sphingopyxis panaciterrulae TaxID=462372 RepID=A0A7W9ENX7_9SPHN|nr:hypothetical protein [Sphingopyxis panaciterrulae]